VPWGLLLLALALPAVAMNNEAEASSWETDGHGVSEIMEGPGKQQPSPAYG